MPAGPRPVPIPGSYDLEGPAGAPLLVFVHGTRLNRAAWLPQVRRLRDRYRCLTLDLPGHGALGGQPFTLPGAAEHVASVVRAAADGAPVVLVGLSLGGYVAIEAAARVPGLADGLVLAGCSADPVGWRGRVFAGFAWLLHRTPEPLLALASDAILGLGYGRELLRAVRAHGYGFAGGAQAVRSLVGGRFGARLRGLAGPAIVVNGWRDPVFRPGARAWVGHRPDTRVVVLRRAGHLSNLDRPDAFGDLVAGLADSLAARSG